MELNKTFTNGLWNKEINVSDFVSKNIAPYTGDASFLQGPTERTKRIWDICLKLSKKKGTTMASVHWTIPPYLPSLLIKPGILIRTMNLLSVCRLMNC